MRCASFGLVLRAESVKGIRYTLVENTLFSIYLDLHCLLMSLLWDGRQ